MLIRLFIIDEDLESVERFKKDAFSSEKVQIIGSAPDVETAVNMMNKNRPDIILIDQNVDGNNGLMVSETVIEAFPDIPIYLTTASSNYIEMWRQAKRKGLSGIIKKPYTISNIMQNIAEGMGGDDEADIVPQTEKAQELTTSIFKSEENKQRIMKSESGKIHVINKEIIVFYSPKGGVGKSTLACNVATAIANAPQKLKTVLVDLDVSFGNIESILGIDRGAPHVLDWKPHDEDVFDQSLIDQLVTKHKSGFDVILTPARAEEAAKINDSGKGKELVEKILKVLVKYYDIVIIDVGPSLKEDSTIAALDACTKMFFISTSDISTIRNLVSCKETFQNIKVEQNKIRMIFNRMLKKSDIDMSVLMEHLPYEVAATIPEEEAVQHIANQCKLPFTENSKLKFSEEIIKIVNHIAPLYTEPKKSRFVLAGLMDKMRDKKGGNK